MLCDHGIIGKNQKRDMGESERRRCDMWDRAKETRIE